MNDHREQAFEELSHAAFARGIAARPLQLLFAHWDNLRGDALVPERRLFRPERLPRTLVPHIGLVKVERRGASLNFDYRIVGSAMNRSFGHSQPRLVLAAQTPAGYGRALHMLYSLAAETHAAVLWTAPNILFDGQQQEVQRLCLPLSEGPGGPVGHLLLSSVAPSPADRAPAEDVYGDLILDVAPGAPVQVCARRPPQAIAA